MYFKIIFNSVFSKWLQFCIFGGGPCGIRCSFYSNMNQIYIEVINRCQIKRITGTNRLIGGKQTMNITVSRNGSKAGALKFNTYDFKNMHHPPSDNNSYIHYQVTNVNPNMTNSSR